MMSKAIEVSNDECPYVSHRLTLRSQVCIGGESIYTGWHHRGKHKILSRQGHQFVGVVGCFITYIHSFINPVDQDQDIGHVIQLNTLSN
jgi:hypothetical protein